MSRRTVTALVAVAPLILTLGEPLAAWARAGGGQGYGGGGGGGFSGGSGGGLWGLWPLLFFGHGGFSTIIVLIVLYYLYQRYTQRQAAQLGDMAGGGLDAQDVRRLARQGSWSPTLDAGVTDDDASGQIWVGQTSAKVDPNAIATGLAAIKARDPNFDQAAFLDRAQTAFFKLQQAWQARNQDLARDVMSDALYERHKMQTDQLIANHQIDMLENIVIGHAGIVGVNAATPYDSIVVAISATMTDYTIDENTKQVVSGNKFPQTFTERWTFIRRADAKSTAGSTQLASSCPSCGAPLSLQNGRCTYCGAPVRTSSSDWVVDSIEQTT
ncbi:MAG: TIM44-like domain-containing protein [Candidatus Eremiobacteraeota bacterium]|nr:TIM44-like domain-containing protein [Candidatus Eremiobacteraeota bacterium]